MCWLLIAIGVIAGLGILVGALLLWLVGRSRVV